MSLLSLMGFRLEKSFREWLENHLRFWQKNLPLMLLKSMSISHLCLVTFATTRKKIGKVREELSFLSCPDVNRSNSKYNYQEIAWEILP